MDNPFSVTYKPESALQNSGNAYSAPSVHNRDSAHSSSQDIPSALANHIDALRSPAPDSANISPYAQLVSSSGFSSSEFKQSSQASIEIMTQDGDRIELRYSSNMQYSFSEQFTQSAQQSAYSSSLSATTAISFELKVEGQLDAAEQRALETLMQDIGEIAGKFFKGDVQAAFNAAQNLGFDGTELKSLALDFQQNTQAEVVKAYQQTQQMLNPESMITDRIEVGPGPAVNVLAHLEQLLNEVQQNELLEGPDKIVKDLLNDIFETYDEAFEYPVKDYIKELVEQF